MSGRVRWRPWLGYRHVREMRVDGATVGELLTYSDHVRALYYGVTPDDSGRRAFRRRSDAKRWLLARAAGLAEVPRARRRHSRSGWQCIDRVGPISVWERNRRRR